jgi:NADPH-dependent curcumin reductase CurA
MHGRCMRETKSYIFPFQEGKSPGGGFVDQIMKSNNDQFKDVTTFLKFRLSTGPQTVTRAT